MRVTLSIGARRDLTSIGDWIARDNREVADRIIQELLDACEEIGEYSELYALMEDRVVSHFELRGL